MGAPDQVARCPRCGYDLSGTVASWSTSCEVDGVCSECGLAFAWRDVLDPRRTVPAWSFEHARRLVPVRFVVTAVRALWPWTFWRRIRMEQPIRGWRLAAWVAMMLLSSHTFIAINNAIHARNTMQTTRQVAPIAPIAPTAPSMAAQIREHMLIAAAWPYAETKTSAPFGALGTRVWTSKPSIPARVWLGPLALSLIPVAFLLLGQSMRLARIRRAHLVRIWAYSMVLAPVSVALWIFDDPPTENASAIALTLSYGLSIAWMTVPALTLGAAGLMWWCATTRYLRLKHGPAAAVMMTLLVGLAMLTGLVLVSPTQARADGASQGRLQMD
jgi:hypothetical protein